MLVLVKCPRPLFCLAFAIMCYSYRVDPLCFDPCLLLCHTTNISVPSRLLPSTSSFFLCNFITYENMVNQVIRSRRIVLFLSPTSQSRSLVILYYDIYSSCFVRSQRVKPVTGQEVSESLQQSTVPLPAALTAFPFSREADTFNPLKKLRGQSSGSAH